MKDMTERSCSLFIDVNEDSNFLDSFFFLKSLFSRRICRFRRFLRVACRLGVALLLDASTILRVTRVGFFLVLLVMDAARLSLRVLHCWCMWGA